MDVDFNFLTSQTLTTLCRDHWSLTVWNKQENSCKINQTAVMLPLRERFCSMYFFFAYFTIKHYFQFALRPFIPQEFQAIDWTRMNSIIFFRNLFVEMLATVCLYVSQSSKNWSELGEILITVHYYDGKNLEIKVSDENNWIYITRHIFVMFWAFAELVTLMLLF